MDTRRESVMASSGRWRRFGGRLALAALIWLLPQPVWSSPANLVHGHWPDVPMISTTCEKVQDLAREGNVDAISEFYYNSVVGIVLTTYQFADGTTIQTRWIVVDLAHESASDESIKVLARMTAYTIMFNGVSEMWVDIGGQGDCKDFRLRS